MTKKSLSDLLKEEASKADTLGEVPASAVASDGHTPQEDLATPLTSDHPPATPHATFKAPEKAKKSSRAAAKQAPSPQRQRAPEQPAAPEADLAVTLATVQQEKAALAAENVDLEKTVQGLQQDLTAQQSRLFELTDSLDQAQRDLAAKTAALQAAEQALAEAKATILKLTAPPSPPTPAPLARESAPARRSGGDIVPRSPVVGPAKLGYVRGVPTTVPQVEQPNPMLSDADIGWVD